MRSGKEAGGIRGENIVHPSWHLGKHKLVSVSLFSLTTLYLSPWEVTVVKSYLRCSDAPNKLFIVKRHSFLFALFTFHSSHLNPLRKEVTHLGLSFSWERRNVWLVKQLWSSPPSNLFLWGSRVDVLVDESVLPKKWKSFDICLRISLFRWSSGCYCRRPRTFLACTAQWTAMKCAVSTSTYIAFRDSTNQGQTRAVQLSGVCVI